MNPKDFTASQAGRVLRTATGYWSFIPAPLPPPISYDANIALLLSQADAALSELSGLGRYLPNPDLLIAPYVKREAVASSRIEGTQADLSDLLLDEIEPKRTPPGSDVLEVRNYVAALLAQFRIDYHAAVFFFDPFSHYSHEERVGLGLDGRHGLPEGIPKRLAKYFKQDDLSVAAVRRYFRAASSPPHLRQAAKAQRTRKLRRILEKRIAEMAPGQEQSLLPILSRTGLEVQGQTLAVSIYPLFFEDWIDELMRR